MKHFFLRKLLLTSSCLAALSIISLPVKAQTFFNIPDNKNQGNIDIFLVSDQKVSGTITNNNIDNNFNQSFNIIPGSTTTVTIDNTFYLTNAGEVSKNGFVIESDQNEPFIAYLFDNNTPSATNDIANLFPLQDLGTSYRIMASTDNNSKIQDKDGSQLSFTATKNNTTVTVTPSVDLTTGESKDNSFDVVLQRNESIMYYGANDGDLTGTTLKSDKPIAVFAGNRCAYVPSNAEFACDHIIEQMPTTENFGKEFIVVPTKYFGSPHGDVIKILANEENTAVTLNENGTKTDFNLKAGEFVTLESSSERITESSVITSDKPILVGQFMVSLDQTNEGDEGQGDPSFSLVPHSDQWFDSYLVNVPLGYPPQNFFNIASTQFGIASLTLNGVSVDSSLFSPISGTNYFGGLIEVMDGYNEVQADVPFMLLTHGFNDNFSSYFGVGGSISPNTNPPEPTDTPEPGSLLGLGLFTGLGWLLKKKSNG